MAITIREALAQFLAEQTKQLKPRTRRKYEGVIELLQICLNNYGHIYLDKKDDDLFAKLYKEKQMQFCDIFGPDKIVPIYDEFLDSFMIHKVEAGKDLIKTAGTVTKKLARWLKDKGYISNKEMKTATESAAASTKRLTASKDALNLLQDYVRDNEPLTWSDEIDGHFRIVKITPGHLWVDNFLTGEHIGRIAVSQEISNSCKTGWVISGSLVKTRNVWKFLDVWTVDPL